MALPGKAFIGQHASAFFLNSLGTVYRIDSSTNDGAVGVTITRVAFQEIRCEIREAQQGPAFDALEGNAPTNQKLFDLIYESGVDLLVTDEIVIGENRYAIVGHVNSLTNQATRRTALKLIT